MNIRDLVVIAGIATLSLPAFAENKAQAGAGADIKADTPAGSAGAAANVGAGAEANRGASPGAGAAAATGADAALEKRGRGATAGTGAGAAVKGKRPEEPAR